MATAANPLTDLSTVLQNLFLGKSQSTKENSTVSSRADASVIERLQGIMDEAVANSNNPDKVQPIVDNIIKQATIAFAPTLAREAASGGYNSSVRAQLASQAAGDAASAAASATLNYKSQQQQIANQAGASLVNATKTTTTTGGQKAATNPAVPSGISSTALGGLGLYTAYKNKDKILDFITGGSAAGDIPNVQLTPGTPLYDTILGADFAGAQAMLDPGAASFYQAANDITGSVDFITGHGGAAIPEVTQFNFSELLGDLPSEVWDWGGQGIEVAGDALDVTGDLAGAAGDAIDITDFFSGAGDFLGGIFDEILNFF